MAPTSRTIAPAARTEARRRGARAPTRIASMPQTATTWVAWPDGKDHPVTLSATRSARGPGPAHQGLHDVVQRDRPRQGCPERHPRTPVAAPPQEPAADDDGHRNEHGVRPEPGQELRGRGEPADPVGAHPPFEARVDQGHLVVVDHVLGQGSEDPGGQRTQHHDERQCVAGRAGLEATGQPAGQPWKAAAEPGDGGPTGEATSEAVSPAPDVGPDHADHDRARMPSPIHFATRSISRHAAPPKKPTRLNVVAHTAPPVTLASRNRG